MALVTLHCAKGKFTQQHGRNEKTKQATWSEDRPQSVLQDDTVTKQRVKQWPGMRPSYCELIELMSVFSPLAKAATFMIAEFDFIVRSVEVKKKKTNSLTPQYWGVNVRWFKIQSQKHELLWVNTDINHTFKEFWKHSTELHIGEFPRTYRKENTSEHRTITTTKKSQQQTSTQSRDWEWFI